MLTHHDSRSYDVAASEAAHHARGIMERKIDEGRSRALATIERIRDEIPTDSLVRGLALDFGVHAGVDVGAPGIIVGDASIHPHALTQIASKAGIPTAYLRSLAEGTLWQRDIAADILTRTYHLDVELANARHLVRQVKGQVRGFLSDRFRRLDSRPLLDAFVGGCQEAGLVATDGTASDVRVAVKAYIPQVFEPVDNEVLCYGLEWSNSDYGAGRHSLRATIWRLWCTNRATLEDAIAQVHLGGRLSDDIAWSERTLMLDTEANAAAVRDAVAALTAPGRVNAMMDAIRACADKAVSWDQLSRKLGKALLKSELATARDMYEADQSPNLPSVHSIWRASNVISWIAGQTESPDRKLELERLAGAILTGERIEAPVMA